MNRFLIMVITACSLLSCDLERVEPNSTTATKFNTSVGGGGNDFPYDVLPLSDGSFIVVGRTQSFTADMNNQAYILKVDKNGILIDQNNFGTPEDDWAIAVVSVSDGGFIFAGLTQDPTNFNFNIFLVKVNSALDEVWRNTFGSVDTNELSFGLIPVGTSDFLVGYTAQPYSGGTNIPVKFLRVNANGAKVSNKTGVTGYFSMADMIKTSDNKIVITGSSFEIGGGTAAYMAKFNEDGSFIWDNVFPSTNINYSPAYGLVELSDRGLIMAGSDLGANDHDFMVVGFTESGGNLINRIWGGANADELLSVTRSQDDHIVTMGYTTSFSPSLEIYVSKRSRTDGSEIWEKHFSETWGITGDIALCPDGGFIICTGQNQANADIVLVKMDANGEYQ